MSLEHNNSFKQARTEQLRRMYAEVDYDTLSEDKKQEIIKSFVNSDLTIEEIQRIVDNVRDFQKMKKYSNGHYS